MSHKIQCRVDLINADGTFTVKGVDGYRLERDGVSYNVFWKFSNDKIMGAKELLHVENGNENEVVSRRLFEMLLVAKLNSQKVELDVCIDCSTNLMIVKNVKLI